MSQRQPFHLPRTPIRSGTTLIEASAGTGKTYTIAGLFLRLILERDLSVRQILVVTFTEAATEELRDRIRHTLHEAATALARPDHPNVVLRELLEPHRAQTATLQARLDRALAGFDEAPIFTIHSFCQRVLKDRAFESGELFDTELLTDDAKLIQEIADDFWRLRFHDLKAPAAALLLREKLSPEDLLPDLRLHLRHPGLRLLTPDYARELATVKPRSEPHRSRRGDEADAVEAGSIRLLTSAATADREDVGIASVFAAASGAFALARAEWEANREAILEGVQPNPTWAKIDFRREAPAMAGLLAEAFRAATPLPDHLDALIFFSAASLRAATKSKQPTPSHLFFNHCQKLAEAAAALGTVLRLEFLAFARQRLPKCKRARKIQTFDDLLNRLHAALDGPAADALAHEVRQRYPAALIDEFQDTDPVQYQIFHRIFGAAETSSLLFLIGDPKQAIYGFRGADIFTYLEAAQRVEHHFTLDRNWRSETGLVRAVNTVFARGKGSPPSPFLFDEIHFDPVTAAGRADETPLTDRGQRTEPFHLWFLQRETDAASISRERAEATLPGLVAAEIVRLLNDDVRLGTERVTPRDIAVLVRKKDQARLMQNALRARGIPSVLHTEESVFNSQEAAELARVLASIARPGSERRLRAALATSLLGNDGAGIEAHAAHDDRWQARLQQENLALDRWVHSGFTPMFRQWLQAHQVRPRLLKFPDGERRLTNLLHLAELLHQAAQAQQLAPAALVRWLEQQIHGGERAAEEHQLRLERDDQAVRLVTIHKSKGLEYPIVFCPFSWDHSDLRKDEQNQVLFHRRASSGPDELQPAEFICDLGSADIAAHRQLSVRERLAENLRLFYVALTRARHRCYLVWGGFLKAGTSAPAWLLHAPPDNPPAFRETLEAHFKDLNDAKMLAQLRQLTEASRSADGTPAIRVVPIDPSPVADTSAYQPPANQAAPLAPRVFQGRIRRDWRITSFSQLIAGAHDEAPDHDRLPPAARAPEPADENEAPAPDSIFALPRGAAPGTCLHEIFELLEFTESQPGPIRQIVADTLQAHGIDRKFVPAVCANVRAVLDVPLDPVDPSFTLSRVSATARLNELEFLFPVEQVTPALLRDGFSGSAVDGSFLRHLERLEFERTGGFIKGFIDLVFERAGRFYIADWKSNWLGNRHEDYHADAMNAEMAAHFYPLQYHLYCVALHQYLASRLPGYDHDRHFGGVFYIFLRGVDPARPELGVVRDRPSRERIETLSRLLLPARTSPIANA